MLRKYRIHVRKSKHCLILLLVHFQLHEERISTKDHIVTDGYALKFCFEPDLHFRTSAITLYNSGTKLF